MAIEGRSISLPYPYPDQTTGVWDAFALLRNLTFLASKITAIATGQLMPSGTMIMMRSGSTCPAGYNKVTDAGLANRYLRLNISTGGGTGGAATSIVTSSGGHTHTNGVPSSTIPVDGTLLSTTVRVASSTHIHILTSAGGHTHTATITPLFVDIILCEKT
jgi:hypothetical protein